MDNMSKHRQYSILTVALILIVLSWDCQLLALGEIFILCTRAVSLLKEKK